MQIKRVFVAILGCLSMALMVNVQTSANAQTAPTDLDADLPVAGRSLFDRLTMAASDPATSTPKVPYPFPKLLEFLKANGADIQYALLPVGRSLQRLEAAPHFFRFPRVVIAATPSSAATATKSAVNGNVYIGYVEPSDQLEVISINPALGRFEFQIVKNYSKGADQHIYYANRAICTTCHQNKATIFATNTWFETQQDDTVVALLGKYLGSEYLGLNTGAGEPFSGASRQSPQFVDSASDQGSARLFVQDMWTRSCTTIGEQAAVCRAFLVEAMLSGIQRFGPSSDDALFKRFAPAWDAHFAINYPAGFAFPMANILSRHPAPLKPNGGNYTTAELLSQDETALGDLYQKNMINIPAYLDPAVATSHNQVPLSNAQEQELEPRTSDAMVARGFLPFARLGDSVFHPVDVNQLTHSLVGPSGAGRFAQFQFTFTTAAGAGLNGAVQANFQGGLAPLAVGHAPLFATQGVPGNCQPQEGAIAACMFSGPFVSSPGTGTGTVLNNIRVVILEQNRDNVIYSKANFAAEGDFDSLCFRSNHNGDTIKVSCYDYDPRRLGHALSQWADAASTDPSNPLNDPVVKPYELMSGVFSLFGIAATPLSCCSAAVPAGLPPPELEPDFGLPRALLTDPDLQTIANSCYRCHHTPGGPRAFLHGATENEIAGKVRDASARMMIRVTSLGSSMPPAPSAESQGLDASGRQALVGAIQKFMTAAP